MGVIPETRLDSSTYRTCWQCGAECALLMVVSRRYVLVDREPHRSGRFALLRGGARVVSLDDPRLDPTKVDNPPLLRFVEHRLTCRVPSSQTATSSTEPVRRSSTAVRP